MHQRFWTYTSPIRAGAKTVSVYNDGLTVFLYDAANESKIQSANPPVLTEGCAEDTLNEDSKALVEVDLSLLEPNPIAAPLWTQTW
ncbi:hypothetical protein [Acaryochloris sp. CCMEE 5410]|uniref:hypothetical protein n=1 Tax=Acaryochloris sp. CCMEE 5410 TaxID=310037 RepID=UPI0002484721|nr:hypothetical protein [Acaryochloris sp. CCMEE 5410]KAI9131972.1 hypothetical protein ON05_000095 [Acaryochloris sp. CCMEE 5410]